MPGFQSQLDGVVSQWLPFELPRPIRLQEYHADDDELQLNISFPANGSQKLFDIEEERKTHVFLEKRVRAPPSPTHLDCFTKAGGIFLGKKNRMANMGYG